MSFHAQNVVWQANVYFEYVASKSNVADLPSRNAMKELYNILDGMGWRDITQKVKCKLPDFADWDQPAANWIDLAKLRATRRRKRMRERN